MCVCVCSWERQNYSSSALVRPSAPPKVIPDCCDVMSEMVESSDTIKSVVRALSSGRLLSPCSPGCR